MNSSVSKVIINLKSKIAKIALSNMLIIVTFDVDKINIVVFCFLSFLSLLYFSDSLGFLGFLRFLGFLDFLRFLCFLSFFGFLDFLGFLGFLGSSCFRLSAILGFCFL